MANKKKKPYVPPKPHKKRTTLWLHNDDAKDTFHELTEDAGVKEHVVNAIGRMIVNGEFDYKQKEKEKDKSKRVRADGNYLLFLEVKEKVKNLGYNSISDLFNEILSEDKEFISKNIERELNKEEL